MIRNLILIAFRNFTRNRTYTFLSLLGLTLGASSVIAIFSFLNLQTRYNAYNSHADEIYRVVSVYKSGDQEQSFSTVPHPLSQALKAEVTGIEAASNMYELSAQVNIPHEGGFKKIDQKEIGFASQDLLEILDFHWVAGSPDQALTEPDAVIISASTAKKFFDINEQYDLAIGKVINLAGKHDLIVKAVYEDLPKATDFPFQMIANYDAQEGVNPYFGKGKIWDRLNGATQALIRINPAADITSMEANVNSVIHKYVRMEGYSVFLQPLRTVHFTEYGNYSNSSLSPESTRIILAIAVLLVVISSINFINISTARAVKRAREVGIRKVLGGQRISLMVQFLLESFIIMLMAHLISFMVAETMLKMASTILEISIDIRDVSPVNWVLFTSVSIISISLLSGLYPAFVLSGFSPLTAIKTKISNIDRQSRFPLRKVLVGLQFVVSIGLIMATVVVIFQMEYLKNQSMGFRKQGVINVYFPEPDARRQELLKTELLKNPEIAAVSLGLGSPLAGTNNTAQYFTPEQGEQEAFTVNVKDIDEHYLEVFDLPLLAGRNLQTTDSTRQVLVTESMVHKMGLISPEDAIGKVIQATWGGKHQVVGVIRDFHANSLKEELMPVMMYYNPDYFYVMSVVLADSNSEASEKGLAIVNSAWERVFPELLFENEFLDEKIANQYEFEQIMLKALWFFAGMAIVICAIGLYGLTDYMANARRKELGIRKVVGASVLQLVNLFTREVLLILGIAFAISAAGTYLAMQNWLAGYAYHVGIGWGIIAVSLLGTMVLAGATMGYRSYTAARLNPVDVLKDE